MERKDSQISSATVRHCILQDEHLVLCGKRNHINYCYVSDIVKSDTIVQRLPQEVDRVDLI